MKKVLGLSLVAAMALATQVSAADSKLEVSSSAALTSNYIWRGISYSAGTTTAQMGIDLSNVAGVSGFHVNFWGSGIQEGSEIDTIVGYTTKAGSVEIDTSIINYSYTRDNISGTFAGASYAEAYIALTAGDYGLAVYQELGYEASKDYDGTTLNVSAAFGMIDMYAGARTSVTTDDSFYAAIGATWDCKLIPTYSMNATVAYNSGFETSQSLQGVEGATFALTLSKDF